MDSFRIFHQSFTILSWSCVFFNFSYLSLLDCELDNSIHRKETKYLPSHLACHQFISSSSCHHTLCYILLRGRLCGRGKCRLDTLWVLSHNCYACIAQYRTICRSLSPLASLQIYEALEYSSRWKHRGICPVVRPWWSRSIDSSRLVLRRWRQ